MITINYNRVIISLLIILWLGTPKESTREFKLAIYYAPLAASLNQEQLESIPSDAYDKAPSKKDTTVKSAPLLDE